MKFKIEIQVKTESDWDVIRLGTTVYSLLSLAQKHSIVDENKKLIDNMLNTIRVEKVE